MKTLNDLLRDADPVEHEPGLTGSDVERIRRAMLNAPIEAPRRPWSHSLVFAGGLALTIAILVIRWPVTPPSAPVIPVASHAPETPSTEAQDRRQLQFATPGGTRVIWVFDSTFEMR